MHCKRHFSRKDLYDNHMNTRFHAKRVEELAQGKAARAESLAAQSRIARINRAYPEATNTNTEEGSSSPVLTHPSNPTSPTAVSAPAATELEQPLLPLSRTGGYGSMPQYLSSEFEPDFTEDYNMDYHNSFPVSSELTPSVLAHFAKPTAELSTLVDYQDSDISDPSRRKSHLYGLQREHQQPLHLSRWSQYQDPLANRLPAEDDMNSVSTSSSATGTSSPHAANAANGMALPMRVFLLNRSTIHGNSNGRSTITDSTSSVAPSMSSLSTAPTSHSSQPEMGPLRKGGHKRVASGTTALSSLANDQYARNLFEPYVAAAQHLQSIKTDMLAFQDSEKLQRLLREPPQAALFAENFNKQFLWFFDNHYGTPSAKIGYDHCYAQTNSEYQARAREFEGESPNQRPANREYRPLDDTASYMVLRILKEAPRELFEDPTMIDYYMHIAWSHTSAIHYIVHLPTFDPSHCHPALLATLVVLGMAISRDPQAELAAKILYPSVLSATYESVLDSASSSGGNRHETPHIGQLQAFTLLMRYEQLILGKETARLSLLHGPTSTPMIDRFFWVLLSTVHHWNGPQTPLWSLGPNQKPLWATVGPESYAFHPYCMTNLQWREWARYEMAKRTLHLALFCDNIHCLSAGSDNVRPVSIFNMDTHMICNEWLWDARSPAEFFYIVGPTKTIQCLPYLGLIKSLVRFPRIPSGSTNRRMDQERPRGSPPLWSLFSLRVLAYGLTNIVGRLSGVSEHGEQLVQRIFNADYISGSNPPSAMGGDFISPLFDRSIQSRLYRGLDLWLQYFEDTYGKVTERIFSIAGGTNDDDMHINSVLNEDLAMIDLDDAQEGIPGYVFVVVFYHYSSFLFVHEDLPIVLQVASNMKGWLDVPVQVPYANLLDRLCVPLYTQWLQSNEATAMLSTSCLTIAWLDASMGRLPTKLFNNQFLASVTFIAVLVVWMHDLTRGGVPVGVTQSALPPLALENYKFLQDAVLHLQVLSGTSNAPSSKASGDSNSILGFSNDVPPHRASELGGPGDKVRSVLLLAECILYGRPNSERLVSFLMRLLEAIDSRLTPPIQQAVLSGSRQFYAQRRTI